MSQIDVTNIELIVVGHWYGINTHCWFPKHRFIPSCTNDEAQQAPLYYLAMAAWQKVVGLPTRPPPTERTSFRWFANMVSSSSTTAPRTIDFSFGSLSQHRTRGLNRLDGVPGDTTGES